MSTSAHKLMAVCMVAVFSMVAYGCSSNNNGAKMERDEALAEVTRLTGELATANENLATANARVMELDGMLATATADLGTANARVMELDGMLATATADLGTANARVMELDGMLATATADLGTANARVMELDGMLATANARVMELDGMLATATADLGTANARVMELDGMLATANARVMELDGMLATATADLGTANARVMELNGMLATATADLGTANARVMELNGMLATATADLGTANARIKELEGMLATANATVAYTVAKSGYDTAQTASLAAIIAYGKEDANVDDATDLVAKAEAAQTAAVALQTSAAGGTVAQMAYAQNAVDAAGDAVRAARDELAQATTTESAMPYAAAIKGVGERAAAPITSITATAKRTGDAVTVDTTADMDEAKGSASDVGGGWYKADVANEDDSKKTATVYTNIEDTMDKFSNVHNPTDNAGIDTVTNGVLELNESNFDELNEHVSADYFIAATSGATTTVTYESDDEDFSPRKFDGTFGGVDGEYACTGDTCTATTDDKGEFTAALVGAWTFTPAYLGEDGESQAGDTDEQIATRKDDLTEPNVPVPDTDYLRFGYWTIVDKDGDVTFQTFFGGAEPFTSSTVTALEGTATYEGPAAGRYAVKTFNPNASLDSIRQGEFTATAELTANFGGDDIAVSQHDRISGTVDGFKGEHGDDLSTWKVMLNTIELTATTFEDGEVSGAGNVGGSPVTSGSWNGAFFGNAAADATGDDQHPGSVAGEFDAHSSHGHVAGAFGAMKQ